MSNLQLDGLYIFGAVTIAMMMNSEYIRQTQKNEEKKRVDELLNEVTDRPVYNENMEYRHSIGGLRKTKKQNKYFKH